MIPEGGTPQARVNKPNRRKKQDRASRSRTTAPRRSEPRGQSGTMPTSGGEFWWIDGDARISQSYGNTNPMYEHGYHDGMDIAVPAGSSLAALTSGTVVYAGNAGADGFRVGIKMPNGKVYYYGHMSSISVEVGDHVGRGQVVGKSGNTGRSSGPHVHFELDRDTNGTGDSPYAFLRRWTGGKFADSGSGTGGGGSRGTSAKNVPNVETSTSGDDNIYQWADAVFNSNPELKALLRKAKSQDWDGATMQAAIRGTDWYRNHSDVWRQNWVLKRDQPETWARKLEQARGTVDAIANEFGVELSEKQRNKIAHDYLWLGLNSQELNEAVGQFFKGGEGQFTGTAGDLQDKVMAMAADYGVRVSEDWIGRFVKGMLTGTMTEQDADNYLKEMAKSAYPTLAAQIDQGLTVKDLAEPYIQSMSRLLEIPDSKIDVYDKAVRKALSSVGADGAPTMQPLWQFEESVRKDPRWLGTNNARDSLLGKANNLLQTWGLT